MQLHDDSAVDPAVLEYLTSGVHHFGLPALSVRIVEGSRCIEAYDLSRGRMPGNAVYKLGSLSKLITAISILLLVEDGALNFGDAVTDYLPWFPWSKTAQDVPSSTIRDLLLHTAGLPRGMFLNGTPTIEDILTILGGSQPECRIYANAERVKYSNLGYILLGWVVEAASAEPYESFVRRRIFTPLGMNSAGFGTPPAKQPFAPPHQLTCFRDWNKSPFDYSLTSLCPAPAAAMDLHATASDFTRVAVCLVGGGSWRGIHLLRPESLACFLSQRVPVRQDLEGGMGVLFASGSFGNIAFEAAEHFGHSAVLYMVPERQFAMIAVTNRASAGADILHMVNAVARTRLIGAAAPPLTHAPSHIAGIIGSYHSADGKVLHIEADTDGVRGSLDYEDWSMIVAKGNNGLLISGGRLSKYPLKTERLEKNILSICAGPHLFHRDRDVAAIEGTKRRSRFAGIYQNSAVGRIAVYERSNTLIVAFSPSKEAKLKPVSETVYIQQDGPFPAEPVHFDPAGQLLHLAGQTFQKTKEIY